MFTKCAVVLFLHSHWSKNSATNFIGYCTTHKHFHLSCCGRAKIHFVQPLLMIFIHARYMPCNLFSARIALKTQVKLNFSDQTIKFIGNSPKFRPRTLIRQVNHHKGLFPATDFKFFDPCYIDRYGYGRPPDLFPDPAGVSSGLAIASWLRFVNLWNSLIVNRYFSGAAESDAI